MIMVAGFLGKIYHENSSVGQLQPTDEITQKTKPWMGVSI